MKRKTNTSIGTISAHPLAFAISAWSVFIGGLTMLGSTTSEAIAALPHAQQLLWGVMAVLAATTTLYGLFVSRHYITVVRGLYIHGCVVTIYGLAIIYHLGWEQGGAAASFAIVIAVVLGAEARNLQQQYVALTKRSEWG